MILFRIIGVFWLSISSMFSYGSNESCDYENDDNVLEVSQEIPSVKNIVYQNYYYYAGLSELGNEIAYNSLLTTLIDQASIESINFVNYNAWYGGRNFNFTADDIGYSPITSSSQAHRFRYNNASIYILMWTGSAYSYQCYGIRIKKITLNNGSGAIYYAYAYQFAYAGSNINDVSLDLFADNRSTYIAHNFGLKYQHYNVDPGDPDYPQGVENPMYVALSTISTGRDDATYNVGYAEGFVAGQNTRNDVDYNAGYQAGLVDGALENPEIASIFTGIFNIGLLPVNVFLEIFNFEIFGINISGIVSGLLTMSVIIIIVRFLFGGKNDK